MEHWHIGGARLDVLKRVLEDRQSRVARMRALNRVLELHLVPEQDEIPCATRHRNRIGERHLPRFVDEEIIEGPLPLGTAEQPCGASHDAAFITSTCIA